MRYMKTHATVLHVADIHLGNLQYHLNERYNDFAVAFNGIVDDAVQRRVDAVLVAGDVFHKRSIDAQTLFQARETFIRLRQAGIPAIVIEGNHDKAFYRDSNVSWLNFLAWSGDIILLAPTQGEEGIRFAPWSPERGEGGCFDIPDTGIRVYGVPWFGGATVLMMQRAAEALRAARDEEDAAGVRFRVLMLHTGVEGEVPALHGLPRREQFAPLRDAVEYVALGHVHKPYHHDNWLFNPGSIETVSAEEAEWKRGYYIVEIDLDGTPRFHAQHVLNRQRPFLRWTFPVDGATSPKRWWRRFARGRASTSHKSPVVRNASVDRRWWMSACAANWISPPRHWMCACWKASCATRCIRCTPSCGRNITRWISRRISATWKAATT